MSVSDGVDLALRGLTVAMKRDSASGDGYLIHTINSKEDPRVLRGRNQ